ncbi:hypothetical protein KEM52_000452, partial [Ascosphaera acerosa]
ECLRTSCLQACLVCLACLVSRARNYRSACRSRSRSRRSMGLAAVCAGARRCPVRMRSVQSRRRTGTGQGG